MNAPARLAPFTRARDAEESLPAGDARAVLQLMTPGRIVNTVTMTCALDPRLHREPPPCPTPDETGTYRGNYEDRKRFDARLPVAEERVRAALAVLLLLGLIEEDLSTIHAPDLDPKRNFYFKRTTWR